MPTQAYTTVPGLGISVSLTGCPVAGAGRLLSSCSPRPRALSAAALFLTTPGRSGGSCLPAVRTEKCCEVAPKVGSFGGYNSAISPAGSVG